MTRKKTMTGFTLAEVLITLGIIGVVAALTIPALIANHKKTAVETRLKKFYSVMNQAITQSELENGDKSTWNIDMSVEYEDLKALAEKIGIKHYQIGPLVRSSYRASELI